MLAAMLVTLEVILPALLQYAPLLMNTSRGQGRRVYQENYWKNHLRALREKNTVS
jgi:hypothetical protein